MAQRWGEDFLRKDELIIKQEEVEEEEEEEEEEGCCTPSDDESHNESEDEQLVSSRETGEITDSESEEVEQNFQRDRDFKKPENKVAVFFGMIPPHVHMRELKEKIYERGLKTSYIRWQGVRGYCIAYFKKTAGLTNEKAVDILRGIRVGENNKRLNVQPERQRTEEEEKRRERTRVKVSDFTGKGLTGDDRIMTYRPPRLKWAPKIFHADDQCRVFLGNVPMNCRAQEIREACEEKDVFPTEIDASKSPMGFSLLYFDRDDGLNSNILGDKLHPLMVRDGSVTLNVQADTRSSRAEDRPLDAPKPGEDFHSLTVNAEDDDSDGDETPNMHRVWVGYIPYGVSLKDFKREVEATGLKPDRYIWKTALGVVILLFTKERGGLGMEDLVRTLWGIRVGSKARSLDVRPDGRDIEGIEEKIRNEEYARRFSGEEKSKKSFDFDQVLAERMRFHVHTKKRKLLLTPEKVGPRKREVNKKSEEKLSKKTSETCTQKKETKHLEQGEISQGVDQSYKHSAEISHVKVNHKKRESMEGHESCQVSSPSASETCKQVPSQKYDEPWTPSVVGNAVSHKTFSSQSIRSHGPPVPSHTTSNQVLSLTGRFMPHPKIPSVRIPLPTSPLDVRMQQQQQQQQRQCVVMSAMPPGLYNLPSPFPLTFLVPTSNSHQLSRHHEPLSQEETIQEQFSSQSDDEDCYVDVVGLSPEVSHNNSCLSEPSEPEAAIPRDESPSISDNCTGENKVEPSSERRSKPTDPRRLRS